MTPGTRCCSRQDIDRMSLRWVCGHNETAHTTRPELVIIHFVSEAWLRIVPELCTVARHPQHVCACRGSGVSLHEQEDVTCVPAASKAVERIVELFGLAGLLQKSHGAGSSGAPKRPCPRAAWIGPAHLDIQASVIYQNW